MILEKAMSDGSVEYVIENNFGEVVHFNEVSAFYEWLRQKDRDFPDFDFEEMLQFVANEYTPSGRYYLPEIFSKSGKIETYEFSSIFREDNHVFIQF